MPFAPNGQRLQTVLLLAIELGRRIDTAAWTQADAPNTAAYYTAHNEGEPSKVEEDGLELEQVESIADCHSTEASWFWEELTTKTGRLFVHITGGGSPVDDDPYIQSYHWSRHATEPYEYDGHAYRGDFDLASAPDVSAKIGRYHESGAELSFGSFSILNGDGHYDALLDYFIWEAHRFHVLIGERGKGDANFQRVVDGWTGSIRWSDDIIEIAAEDLQTYLL